MAMLPTPDANDGARGAGSVYDPKAKNQSSRTVVSAVANGTATGVNTRLRLAPTFVAWMMGYPKGWLDFPMEALSPKQPSAGKA